MTKQEQQFTQTVWDFYEKEGRHNLPWRLTHDPYNVLVSELMLQQTQVERVIPKYEAFIQQWPTVEKLAKAQLGEVLIAWQGLGYNRRAKFLHQCAVTVVKERSGVFPQTRLELESLPGIGPYTAGALLAFAFNQPVVLIETNVRRVYIHHFFPAAEQVTDAQLLPYIERTAPPERSREWYAALMDYGTYLKKTIKNPNKRSAHYKKQSVFKGSDREVRGAIVRLLATSPLTKVALHSALKQYDTKKVQPQLDVLLKDNMITIKKRKYQLP